MKYETNLVSLSGWKKASKKPVGLHRLSSPLKQVFEPINRLLVQGLHPGLDGFAQGFHLLRQL